jgi:arylsulfatase A-like enzyme
MDPEGYTRLAAVDSVLTASSSIALSPDDIDRIQAHYDTMLAFADLQLGLFLAAAERDGHLDNTVVIITGDHGEDLLDHEFMNHRTSLYDSSVRVPMIVTGPGFQAGQRVSRPVSAIDVVPTILELVGDAPLEGLQGLSLRSIASGEAAPREAVFLEGVLNQLGIRTPTHKLVFTGVELVDPALPELLESTELNPYDFRLMDLIADPAEKINLLKEPSDANRALAEDLRSQLVEWRKGIRIRKTWSSVASTTLDMDQLDPETIQRMQDAGYWEPVPQEPEEPEGVQEEPD